MNGSAGQQGTSAEAAQAAGQPERQPSPEQAPASGPAPEQAEQEPALAQFDALANGKQHAQEADHQGGEHWESEGKIEAADASGGASASAADKAKADENAAQLTDAEAQEPAKDTDVEPGEGQGAASPITSEAAAGTSCQAGLVREAAAVTASEKSVPEEHADTCAEAGMEEPTAASTDKLLESPENADLKAGTA